MIRLLFLSYDKKHIYFLNITPKTKTHVQNNQRLSVSFKLFKAQISTIEKRVVSDKEKSRRDVATFTVNFGAF